ISTASVLGGLGFGAYSAANRFMDAYIYLLNRTGQTHWLSVNWDSWQLAEKQIADTMFGSELKELAMTPPEGMAVFERILGWPEARQVIQCTGDLQSRLDRWVKLQGLHTTETETTEKPLSALRQKRPPLSTPYVPARNALEEKIISIWQDLLGYEQIGIQDNFFELNGDSLKTVIAISKIHKQVDVKVPLKDFFAQPTIEGIMPYIIQAQEGSQEIDVIEPVEKKEYYPLSSTQEGMFIMNRYEVEQASTAYNIPSVMELTGELDIEKVQEVFQVLIQRHESLRTSFHLVAGQPVQRIHDSVEFAIETLATDAYGVHGQTRPPGGGSLLKFIRPFDLSQAPLIRVGLRKIEENKHLVILDMHHIVSDGASLGVLVKEFMQLYEHKSLLPLPVQYKDYACRQKEKKLKKQEEYWLQELAEDIPALELPFDHERTLNWDFTGHHVWFELSKEESNGLKALAKAMDVTLYMVLVSIYMILLAKLSGQDDIIIGAPVAGRRHADLQNMIGMFVNTLVLRSTIDKNNSYRDYIQTLKPRILAAFENQDYPFENLVEQKSIHREAGRNPLFDVTFILQNMEIPEIDIPGLALKPFPFESETAKLDLLLIAEERGENLHFAFEYKVKLFKTETIERFSRYYQQAVSKILANPGQRICDIDIIPNEEKRRLLEEFNDTYVDYPRDKTIHQLFEEQAARTPDHISHVGADPRVCPARNVNLTYRQLNEQSDHLAGLLIEKGVLPDDILAIKMARSLEMIAGIMGILKSGGAYLPIDPDYPQERIDYMVKDSKAKLTINYEFLKEAPQAPLHHPSLSTQHSKLAYIIYTSGSTGKPKGVMIDHRSVVNLLFTLQNQYPFTPSDSYLLKTSYTFDISVTELFGWYMGGGKLVILEAGGEKDPHVILNWVQQHWVTHINFVPSMFNAFLEYLDGENNQSLAGLKYIFLAGEALLPGLVKKFKDLNTGIALENLYGPTEGTVYSSGYSLSAWNGMKNVPIGKPIHNAKLYVVDRWSQLVPMGVTGELIIAGLGLARGYLNRPELTAEKFDKYRSYRTNRTYINYKTGDLARWLSDGNIEFLGRIDHQVKIRGFRIELGEIESRLVKHTDIKEAVVIVNENEKEEKSLIAYLVSTRELPELELREHLLAELPDYMIPSYFIRLEKIPLNTHGKLDRKALPKPGLKISEKYTAPRDEMEKKLAAIWSEVLGREEEIQSAIGIDDNFFHLGGHSLKAVGLINRIHHVFSIAMPMKEIFTHPTIRSLAQYIAKAEKSSYFIIEPVKKKAFYPVSSAQKRLYILQQMDDRGTTYNMPSALTWEGPIDVIALRNAFLKSIARHESLRTSFNMINEDPVQVIHDEVNFEIEKLDGRGAPPWSPAIINSFIRPFDLSRAPLLRAGLVQLTENTHLLIVDMHHLISDGISIQILIRDFTAFYSGNELTGIKLQYKDYTEWQLRQKSSPVLLRQGEYWQNQFAGEIPVLNLTTDFPRPTVQSFDGSTMGFRLDNEITRALKTLVMETGTTPYMALLSVYTILIAKLSSQEDIIVGTPTAGRQHADLEKIIGVFVNTLALRTYPTAEKKFSDFLNEVKETAIKGFENQDYQYEDLIEQISLNRDTGRNPLFDFMFVLQNTGSKAIDIPNAKIIPYEFENKTAKFDLTLTAVEEKENWQLTFEYSTKLFKRETIERFSVYFKNIINCVLENKSRRISGIEILTAEEKHRLLWEFNDTQCAYPEDKTIHQLFAEQVSRTPDHIAVFGHGRQRRTRTNTDNNITYFELNEQSDHLAGLLIEKGVLPDTIVAIKIERSVEMITGIFGILKSGGAYLPIDPKYPQERIDYMLKDSNAKILITNKSEIRNSKFETNPNKTNSNDPNKNQNSGAVSVLNFENLNFEFVSCFGFRASNLSSSNLAYVIYTSGTTGKPKGSLIEHHSLVNRLNWMQKAYPLDERDTILQKTTFTFDVSVWEIFWWSMVGARLCLLSPGGEKDPESIAQAIEKNHITTMHFVPSMLSVFLDYIQHERKRGQAKKLATLKQVIASGEALLPAHVERFIHLLTETNGTLLANLYGPTEATIDVSYFNCSPGEREIIPIGKPIDNINLYILDRSFHLQPIGIPGELCIGGVGLARGYLNRPQLTSDKFYRSYWSNRSYILYHTGDLARWLSDGNIEFLGRIDQQVKIRGFRIELGEIENRLLNYPGIKEAIVLAQEESSGDKYLCAYIVSSSEYEAAGIREFLLKGLPDYMIPSYFVSLEQIPLTPNGKVDRNRLPLPQIQPGINSAKSYQPPRNKIEEKLADAWQGILGLENVGIEDNFFDAGGDSIKAIRLASRINEKLNSNLRVVDIYAHNNILKLAGLIDREESQSVQALYRKVTSDFEEIKKRILAQMMEQGTWNPDEIEDVYPMSEIEKGMVFSYTKYMGLGIYHDQFVYHLNYNDFNIDLFKKTLTLLVTKHQILRTGFNLDEFEEPVQVVYKQPKLNLVYNDLSRLSQDEQYDQIEKWLSGDIENPFDSSKYPLWRMSVFTLGDQRLYLLLTFHHAILDGWSVATLMTELYSIYNGLKRNPLSAPPALKSGYRDMVIQERVEKENTWTTRYWQEELADYNRLEFSETLKNKGELEPMKVYRYYAGTDILAKAKHVAMQWNTGIKNLFFSAYAYMMRMFSYENDLVLGCVTHNRPDKLDGDKVLGCFLNTTPVRLQIPNALSWQEYAVMVEQKMLEVKKHERLPLFEIALLIGEKNKDRNPIFDTLFNFTDFHTYREIDIDESSTPIDRKDFTSIEGHLDTNTLFDFEVDITSGNLIIHPKYNVQVISDNMVEKCCIYFMNILEKYIDEPDNLARRDDILPLTEKENLLRHFNDTQADYSREKTMPMLFEEQVVRTPSNTAVIDIDGLRHLTYSELNEKANQLAHGLLQIGVKKGDFIGVIMERRMEMVLAVMGILKAGCAYAPLEPYLPGKRIEKILESLLTTCVITDETNRLKLTEVSAALEPLKHIISLDKMHHKEFAAHSRQNPVLVSSSEDVSYVIHTSGSTGTPKGVVETHRPVVNVVEWVNRTFNVN
ncbi:MAG TPA: amino acid adenylation domain-containing protein, partial [Candidatus Deferrimicrobium sp.]|nr:amino acid adenylation domain-containing protein [Candidatus Deferrimicrobium sp.]